VHRGNRWSRRGIKTHAFMRQVRNRTRELVATENMTEVEALAEALNAALDQLGDDPARAVCEAIPFDRMPVGGSLEVALAWDYETGEARVLHTNGDRDYSAARVTEFVGTADFAGVDPRRRRVIVPDWKTGWTDLGDPRESLTMRTYCLAAARVAEVDEALTGFVYLREDGTAEMKWAELDAVELAETAEQLGELAARLQAPPIRTVNEGTWCTYCPSWLSCPAKVQLAAALHSGVVIDGFGVDSMTLKQLGEAYQKVEQVLPIAERIREAIRERAAVENVPLGDGRVLKAVDWPMTSISARVALPVIRDLHGENAAACAAPPKVTQASIKRAVGNANFKQVFAAIEKAGGVTHATEK
jgi:hypothetical protein